MRSIVLIPGLPRCCVRDGHPGAMDLVVGASIGWSQQTLDRQESQGEDSASWRSHGDPCASLLAHERVPRTRECPVRNRRMRACRRSCVCWVSGRASDAVYGSDDHQGKVQSFERTRGMDRGMSNRPIGFATSRSSRTLVLQFRCVGPGTDGALPLQIEVDGQLRNSL